MQETLTTMIFFSIPIHTAWKGKKSPKMTQLCGMSGVVITPKKCISKPTTIVSHPELSQHNFWNMIFAVMGIASVFIAVGLIACVMSKSLNSVAGRCKLMLLLSLLLLYFVYTVIMNQFDVVQPHLDDITLVLIFAYLMMCLWMTVMAFDIWWTFRWVNLIFWNRTRNSRKTILRSFVPKRYQIKTQDVSRKFRTYCFYVFGCIVFLYLAAITADMLNIGLFFYLKWQLSGFVVLVLSVADIVLLIHTGIMVSRFVKASETSRNAWFEAEKERWELKTFLNLCSSFGSYSFWSYLGVFCVLLITRIFELYTFKTRSFRQKFVVNSITAFSAIVIVFILAFKKILISSKKCFV